MHLEEEKSINKLNIDLKKVARYQEFYLKQLETSPKEYIISL